jgi:hypothetical protein
MATKQKYFIEELKRTAGDKSYDEKALLRYESEMKTSPIGILIDEGMFSSIADDVENSPVSEKWKKKFGIVTKVTDQLLMTHNTSLYKFMFKATSYADFIAKYTLFYHLIEKQGYSRKRALSEATESVVQYEAPLHKGVKFLEEMGPIRFMKFFLRSKRVLARLFRTKPERVLGLMVGQAMLFDVPDVFDGSTNLLSRVVNPMQDIDTILHPPVLETLGIA